MNMNKEYIENIYEMADKLEKTNAEDFIDTFEKYIDFVDIPSQYLKALKIVSFSIDKKIMDKIEFKEIMLMFQDEIPNNEIVSIEDILRNANDLKDEDIHELIANLIL